MAAFNKTHQRGGLPAKRPPDSAKCNTRSVIREGEECIQHNFIKKIRWLIQRGVL